ncbi:hypothetical protein HanIR_Chr14g0705291 [Helianthus annuus]|nr:hypothetical protein HanIR_Chr14g0705291 [Helianthus annuus]
MMKIKTMSVNTIDHRVIIYQVSLVSWHDSIYDSKLRLRGMRRGWGVGWLKTSKSPPRVGLGLGVAQGAGV